MTGSAEHRHVVFTPSGRRGSVPTGTTVLAAARELGVDLDSVCGGRGICGHCQVVPAAGSFAKWAIESTVDALRAPGSAESAARPAREVTAGARLGCLAAIQHDVVIDVPAASQVHRPVVRKAIALDDLVIDPLVTLAYVELRPAEMDGTSLVTAIRAALAAQHGIDVGAVDTGALAGLHRTFAGEPRGGTVVLRRTTDPLPRLVTSVPGFTDHAYGAAIDIGSTTIAGHLVDLTTGAVLASAGRMNPQIRFGEDLMSRVSYVMMNPGGDTDLTVAVRTALDELLVELCGSAGVAATELFDIVLVGNPIMHHLVLGIDPTPLGSAPFELATDEAVATTATALDLGFRNASVYVGPCIAGHVGADTAAAMLAEGPYRSDHPQLLVDIGTNAEIVLGSTTAVWAASSPTGPAFEGAQISSGQRATAGAIERVRIDRDTLAPSVKIIGDEAWTDDTAGSRRGPTVTGVCGSGIIEAIAELFLAGVIAADGTIRGEVAARTDRVVADGRTFSYRLFASGPTQLFVTQNDVRAIQLAKAALRAGIDLLLEHAGLDVITDIRLAGAFGAHIDPLYAMVLGLVPDCPLDGVRGVGNAAGAGAVRALVSASQRTEMEAAVRRVRKVETAIEPRFQELFVAAMAFPHTTASVAHLSQLVDLPARPSSANSARRRRRTPSTTEETS